MKENMTDSEILMYCRKPMIVLALDGSKYRAKAVGHASKFPDMAMSNLVD